MNRDAATHTAQQSHITQRPPEKSVRRSPLYDGSFPKMSRRQYCAEYSTEETSRKSGKIQSITTRASTRSTVLKNTRLRTSAKKGFVRRTHSSAPKEPTIITLSIVSSRQEPVSQRENAPKRPVLPSVQPPSSIHI